MASKYDNRNLILRRALDKCFSSEEQHTSILFPTRINHQMENGLKKALQSGGRDVLWSTDEPSPSNTTESRTHKGIALRTTGNLQGSVKFYYLNTGQVLKRRNFTPIPLPGRLIAKVEDIGNKQNPGREFRSTNRHKKLFGWTDEFQEDDNVFQGLLELEEAAYPDIPAELPGIEFEWNQTEDQTDCITDAVDGAPKPDFEERAAGTLENADIRPGDRRQAQPVVQPADNAAPAQPSKVIYNIRIDLPDDMRPTTINNDQLADNHHSGRCWWGSQAWGKWGSWRRGGQWGSGCRGSAHPPPPPIPLHVAVDNNARYPSWSCSSVTGDQLYDAYLNLNVINNKKYDEGAALLNVHVGAGYKLQQTVQATQLNVIEPDSTEHSVYPEMIA